MYEIYMPVLGEPLSDAFSLFLVNLFLTHFHFEMKVGIKPPY